MIPRSDHEFVGWPQLALDVAHLWFPAVTMNLWGGRNEGKEYLAGKMPGVTLNLWGGCT